MADTTSDSTNTADSTSSTVSSTGQNISNAASGAIGKINDFFFSDSSSALTSEEENPIQRNEILGLPLKFTELTDPEQRVFTKTLCSDLPLVTLMPGNPKFMSVKTEGSPDQVALVKAIIDGKFEEGKDDGRIFAYLLENSKNSGDYRYYRFEPDYEQYFKYVQLLLSTLHVKMGLGYMYNFASDYKQKWGKYGLAFYADKSTSVTESADNDFGSSKLEGMAKGASSIMRELKFILGKNIDIDSVTRLNGDSKNEAIAQSLSEVNGTGIIDKLMRMGGSDKLETIISGAQLQFPEVWQDSKFSRSYSINFKFSAPYGDPLTIFKTVYVPTIALLALSLPKQDTIMGYGSPFIVRLDCPG